MEVAGANPAMVLATLFEGDVCGELAFLSDGNGFAVAKDVEVEVDAFNKCS